MSIVFSVVSTMLLVRAGFVDDRVYSDAVDDEAIATERDWADEALLDVAFYLRLHKFNEFDRRYYLEKNENNSYFYAQFPVPPLITFHWEVYEMCSQDIFKCLKYLHEVVVETHLQRTLTTNHVMRQMNWTLERHSTYMRMVNEDCLRLKALDWTDPKPFRGPLDRFRWRVAASYFMCWYTMQNITLLSRFNKPCDDIGTCSFTENIQDFRTDNTIPYQCALYSFCPDPCCSLRQVMSPIECQIIDPCRYNNVKDNECKFYRNQNTRLSSIIYNEWNVSCTCNTGFEWDSRYGTCIDVNECEAGSHICDVKSETCINLPGRYKCICRWGFMWLADQGICVPDEVVRKAEIRSVTGILSLVVSYCLRVKPLTLFIMFNIFWASKGV